MPDRPPMIDILFDGPPAAKSGRFVEIEDGAGHGINIGEWIQRPDGLWALRIPLHIAPAEKTEATDDLALFRLQKENAGLVAQITEAHRLRMEVEAILDRVLGGEEEDGAGTGLVAEVDLLAHRCEAAEAYIEALGPLTHETHSLPDYVKLKQAEKATRSAWLALRAPAPVDDATELHPKFCSECGRDYTPVPPAAPVCATCGHDKVAHGNMLASPESGQILCSAWGCPCMKWVPAPPAPRTEEDEAAVDGILKDAGCKGPFVDVLKSRWDAALACVASLRLLLPLANRYADAHAGVLNDTLVRDAVNALAAFDATATGGSR